MPSQSSLHNLFAFLHELLHCLTRERYIDNSYLNWIFYRPFRLFIANTYSIYPVNVNGRVIFGELEG